MIRVDNLFFSYGKRPLLRDLSFAIEKGEIVALVGPSGIGKTTLLKLLSGLLPPDQGSVHVDGSVSCLFRKEFLLSWRSVVENVLLPLELGERVEDPEGYVQKAHTLLKQFGLSSFLDAKPEDLSEGMKKITALIQTLLLDKDCLLLDEPFSAIDLYLREKFCSFLKEHIQEEKKTLFFVTHDFRDALFLADRLFFLAGGMLHTEWTLTKEIKTSLSKQEEMLNQIRQSHEEVHPLLT